MSWRIVQGDAAARLRELPAHSVQCCITSPPYLGLRDYGTGEWEGGDLGCEHRGAPKQSAASTLLGNGHGGGKRLSPCLQAQAQPFRETCGKCGARRVDRQLGLEPTPDAYVERLVAIFREVHRVLRDDGTVWLNLGDSYAADHAQQRTRVENYGIQQGIPGSRHRDFLGTPPGLKPKDLVGVPWRVAFALQADGWYLRSDIIWAKTNCMPESVRDRPTQAHEHVFLLAKSASYFYDADAIREDPASYIRQGGSAAWTAESGHTNGVGSRSFHQMSSAGRNRRNVWTVATAPFAEAHFATFPPKLVEPCVLAGTSPKACGICGAPWRRIVELGELAGEAVIQPGPRPAADARGVSEHGLARTNGRTWRTRHERGWEPTCGHESDSGRCLVLDPFAGSGTVGVVCEWYDRDFLGIELNPDYCRMAERRIMRRERPSQAPAVSADQMAFEV